MIIAPVYAAAQSPSGRTVADKFQFQLGQPHKVPPFPLVLNAAVQAYVDSYLAHSEGLRLSYARSAPYLAQMTKVLGEYGVPSDLVYLAFAESSFSKGGAGPWQLTKATARELGLVVNEFLDERRDPLKSTRAAAEYLAQLHDQIGDWRLTIVAWNTGQGMLSHFVQDRGEDFDRLLDHLPARTRSLLSRFMAVAFISKNAKEFGIQEVVYSEPTQYVRISVPGGTPLSKVAEATHSQVFEIQHLNPAILTDRIPPDGYDVAIPLSSKVDAATDWGDNAPHSRTISSISDKANR
ncbi:MAG TPA: lytic transglycosylase domain-containing protein [Candidatus Binataceae bacterium]|nr:lytic transglycosylase domain-containing protein [Candidatus Binataceae bacterium]